MTRKEQAVAKRLVEINAAAERAADALARADKALAPRTRIAVSGFGRGTYVRHSFSRFGANSHDIHFDSVNSVQTIKLAEVAWTVFEAEMDALLSPGPPAPDPAAVRMFEAKVCHQSVQLSAHGTTAAGSQGSSCFAGAGVPDVDCAVLMVGVVHAWGGAERADSNWDGTLTGLISVGAALAATMPKEHMLFGEGWSCGVQTGTIDRPYQLRRTKAVAATHRSSSVIEACAPMPIKLTAKCCG